MFLKILGTIVCIISIIIKCVIGITSGMEGSGRKVVWYAVPSILAHVFLVVALWVN